MARKNPNAEAAAAKAEAKRETQEAVRRAKREAKAAVRQAVGVVDEALQAHVAEHHRRADAATRRAEQLDRLADYLDALDVWTRSEPRERKPRFTRDEIAHAAIHIADTEGLDALSMRRLATELGAGTMTVYHYVRTKDELMTLVTDAIMGEVALPPGESLPDHWRDALTVVAARSRAAMQRHPWVLDIADDPPVGPNGLRHFDQSLQAVASLDVDLRTRLDIVALVDEYVFGHCLNERNEGYGGGGHLPHEARDYVASLLGTGEYPQLEALTAAHGVEGAWDLVASHLRDPGRYDRGLQRLLDGIEASLPPSAG